MLKNQSHIIRKQSLKVSATVDDAFALKRKVENIMESLMPGLNSLFDELTNENEWLQIEKLDIDIGNISEYELEGELSKKILQSLRARIAEHKQDIMRSGEDTGSKALVVSTEQKTVLAFLYFLDNGILPWWFEPNSHAAFEEKLSNALISFVTEVSRRDNFSSDAGDGIGKLNRLFTQLHLVLNNSIARKRLIEQFSEEVFLSVIHWLSSGIHLSVYSEIGNAFQGLKRFFSGYSEDGVKDKMIKEMKVLLLEKVLQAGGTSDHLIREWMRALWKAMEQEANNVKMKKVFETTIAHRYLRDQLKEITTKPIPGEVSPADEKEIVQNQAIEKTTEEHLKELNNYNGAIIANAGLVILAPFLPELFRLCGILKEEEITDINKAIAIMHYAVFGDCDYKEYDVLLNKILCGIDEYHSLEIVVSLTEIEIKEIESMLNSVIAYWVSLKNTSVEGLREGFLVRQGKLTPKYDEWLLQAERHSIDILLQSLPWTISFIKLPWMKKTLRTEWV